MKKMGEGMDPTYRLKIRKATLQDQKAICEFRYRVYVDELKIHQRFADHEKKTVIEPFDSTGHLYVAWDESEIVGLLRVNLPRECSIEPFEELFKMKEMGSAHPSKTCIMSSCLIAESWRGTALMFKLIDVSFTDLLGQGIEHVFFCCSRIYEALYTRLGGKRYPDEVLHPDQGPATVFRCDMMDLEHFKRVGSPVLGVVERFLDQARDPASVPGPRSPDLVL